MYKESKPDAEDYLLGRRLDKVGEDQDKKEGGFVCVVS